jgi:hypothetical protein
MTRCDCCDLPAESCGRAIEQARRDELKALRQRALQQPGVVPARYPGTCPACRTPINPLDPVRRTEDGWTGVLCCPDD